MASPLCEMVWDFNFLFDGLDDERESDKNSVYCDMKEVGRVIKRWVKMRYFFTTPHTNSL